MKQKAKIYKGRRIVIGDKNLITKNEIHVNDIPQEGGESGGGDGGTIPITSENDVNFRDYDGTILYSYTKKEFLALNEFPPLPIQKGLICQEWNWDIAEAKEYVAEYGILEIGANYTTDDGSTRLYISIKEEGRRNVKVVFQQSASDAVTINWGDDSPEVVVSRKGEITNSHLYRSIGDYIITLKVKSGYTMTLGMLYSPNNCVMGRFNKNDNLVYCNMLKRAELGEGVLLEDYAFNSCRSLESVVLPSGIVKIPSHCFEDCGSLKALVIPKQLNKIYNNAFSKSYSLEYVIMPSEITSILNNSFEYCYSLKKVIIPSKTTSVNGYAFYYCYSLKKVIIPKSVTSMEASIFQSCNSLSDVILKANIQNIPTSLFSGCYNLKSIEIPSGVSVVNSYAFSYCKSLCSIEIPEGVTEIKDTGIAYCESLASVVLPKSLATIEKQAFRYCYGVAFYDFRALDSIPVITGPFEGIPSDCQIIVPDALYDEWIAATNWSAYASYTVKASEFNA